MSKRVNMKAPIRAFIATWTDQKLHDVYAFNQDGRMMYTFTCCCLLGVATSEILHSGACTNFRVHYSNVDELRLNRLGNAAEGAYLALGDGGANAEERDYLRQVRLSPMLRAEIRRRSLTTPSTIPQLEEVLVVKK